MTRLGSFLVVAIVHALLSSAGKGLTHATTANAADTQAALEDLGFLLGQWSVRNDATMGQAKFIMLGSNVTTWDGEERWLTSVNHMKVPHYELPMLVQEFVTWDEREEQYLWVGLDDQSAIFHHGTGYWNDSNEWVMLGHAFEWPDGSTYQFRRTFAEESDGSVRHISEMSVDGGEFKVNSTATHRRRTGHHDYLTMQPANSGPQIAMMTPTAELDRLAFLVGSWSTTIDAHIAGAKQRGKGHSTTTWNPQRTWLSTVSKVQIPGNPNTVTIREFVAWDSAAERYAWMLIDDNSSRIHLGTASWNDANEWVMDEEPFEWDDGKTYKFRRTIRRLADSTIHELSEVSVDSGEFVVNANIHRYPGHN